MQEQLSTARLITGAQNRPRGPELLGPAIPYAGDDDAFAPVDTEPKIVEKRPPLALRVLQSVGRAFMALCLSGASTNCVRCNAPVDRYADIKGDSNPVSPYVSYRCRCCGQSWEQYLSIDPTW